MKKRIINCDILRIVAFLFVISVHSMRYLGFYESINSGRLMAILNILRVILMACVPIFMVLTGYLMSHKVLSKEYYLKIKRIILTYLLCSIVCYVVGSYLDEDSIISFKEFIFKLLEFKAAPYSWYVEMYIGLYLIIPFLNILWNNMNSKKERIILILTLFALMSLPTMINIKSHIIPAYWMGSFYAILYYYIGCYFKEYEVKLNIIRVLLLLIPIILNGLLTYKASINSVFLDAIYTSHYSFGVVASTILICLIIFNLKINIKSELINKAIAKVSYLTFGAYLLSYIFDLIIYTLCIDDNTLCISKLFWAPLIILIIFTLSILSSYIISLIELLINKLTKVIIEK